MANKYTSNIQGKTKTLTVVEWVEFLADKPIFDHYTAGKIRTMIRMQYTHGYSISQCLGILEPSLKLVAPNKNKQIFLEVGMQEAYDKVNSMVRRMCLRVAN